MISVGISTSCVYPLGTAEAFRIARSIGFDGVEIMVARDETTRNSSALLDLAARYEVPILSVHAPVLLFTQFVWGTDPIAKLERSAQLAVDVGAPTVVVHPPFRWQRGYAAAFTVLVRHIAAHYGVELAIENMFPWSLGRRRLAAYSPGWDPVVMDCDATTLDFSHASLSGRDSLEMARRLGHRLRHIHLCDGTSSVNDGRVLDEHLVPGRGRQPVGAVLEHLAATGWCGSAMAEVNTRRENTMGRSTMLTETLMFAREHIVAGDRIRATAMPAPGSRGGVASSGFAAGHCESE